MSANSRLNKTTTVGFFSNKRVLYFLLKVRKWICKGIKS